MQDSIKDDPTRRGAFTLVAAVLDKHLSLDAGLAGLPGMAPRDRAAAHRIAASVLRHLGTLDAVLDLFLGKAPPMPVRHVLRIGAAQVLCLGAPSHAAVNTTVDLARAQGLSKFSGLANAVMRKLTGAGAGILDQFDMPRLDTPAWLWASWGGMARDIAIAHGHEAPLDLTLAPGRAPPEGGMLLPTGSVRFPAGTDVTALPGFAAGDFWVQDAAAALPAKLLRVRPGEAVLDLCAAPGGKTMQLAAMGGRVTAIDKDKARLARVRNNLARTGLAAEIVVADAVAYRPGQLFPAILLDAPCSATGTIRRHPDVPHLRRPKDIEALMALQDQLLDSAFSMLAPGGRLVYAVCSLQPAEGKERTDAAIRRLGLRLDPTGPDELPGLVEAVTQEGNIRTHPGLWPEWAGMDGFFAARLIKGSVF
jgi:16S rRNA (cytosine967-C5)-methyltransferase